MSDDDVIILEDSLGDDGMQSIHLMSNKEIVYPVPDHAKAEREIEMGTHILKGRWPYRGPIKINDNVSAVLWGVLDGERIREQAVLAARLYQQIFGSFPLFAWVRNMPEGIELGHPIKIGDDDLGLFDAEFVPIGFLIVGSGILIEIDNGDDGE